MRANPGRRKAHPRESRPIPKPPIAPLQLVIHVVKKRRAGKDGTRQKAHIIQGRIQDFF